jgi:tetratricopeptide (TPR) repeat protein
LDEVGDRSGALRAYEDFARRLARLYEVEPSPKTEALIQALQSREGLSTEVEPATTAAEDRISETTAREATDGKPSTSGRGMPKRRIAKTAIIATLAIAAVTAAAIVLLPRRGPALDEERVVVAIFENRTGDESLEPLGLMAADWITDGLARTGLLDVVPSPDALICCHALDVRAAAGEDVDRVRGLAEATGAGIVVWGAFYQEGDSLRLQAQIIDAAQRQLLIAPEPVSGLIESPSEAVRLLRQRVMGALGTLFDPRLPALGLGSGQPPTFDAYREYAEGVRLTIGWQLREALQHLHQAAALDSTFVQPALFAAPIHYILNEFPQADSITRVVDRQRARLLPSELAYLDFGLGYATGDLHSAAEAVRRQTEISSALFWQFNHIKSAVDVNRPRESLEVQAKFDAESVLLRGWWHYWHWPSQAHHMVGDYRRELQEARRARRQYPDLQPTLSFEVQALAALGRVGELNERLDEGLTLQPQWLFTYTYTMRTAALELRAHGRPDAALKVLDRAIRWHRGLPPDAAEDPFTRYELAQTAYLAGRWDEARAMFEDLTVDLPYSVRYKGAFPCRINYLGYLGALAARRGDREEAMRISGELYIIERHPVTARPRPVWQASIAALLGENERAVELLKGAFSNGLYFGTWLHVDPDFESLHDYPPFQELLQPKG